MIRIWRRDTRRRRVTRAGWWEYVRAEAERRYGKHPKMVEPEWWMRFEAGLRSEVAARPYAENIASGFWDWRL